MQAALEAAIRGCLRPRLEEWAVFAKRRAIREACSLRHFERETMTTQLPAMSLAAVPESSALPDLSRVTRVDEVGVNERVARFQTRSIKTSSKVDAQTPVMVQRKT